MSNSNKNSLRVHKRLLQYNQLPFAFGEINNPSYSIAFKGEIQAYTNAAHGGYYPSLNDWGKLETSTFSADISLDFKDVECDEKVRYFRFIKRQFSKSGKLFATQGGNEIIWTNVRAATINEVVDEPHARDILKLNVTFELIDGYWRIASRTRTFFCEYCPSKFQNFDPNYCFDATDLVGQCDESGASKCIPCEANLYTAPTYEGCDWKPMCNFSRNQLANMFGVNCSNIYAINYSCELEKNYFCFDVPWGRKFRLRADSNYNQTHIQFCTKSDFPTEFLRIRLAGKFYNPKIYQVKNYREYTEVASPGKYANPKAQGWYEKTNTGSYVKSDATRVHKGITYYTYTPTQPKFDIIDSIAPKTQVPIDGIMTVGFGPEIYKTDDKRDPESKTGYVDLSQMFNRSNTPFFELQPGINDFVIEGNELDEDSFAYFEPVEITW